VAKLALEAGKHVLTTKPMEVSLEACEEMIKLADEKGLLLGVDFQMRFEQTSLTLKQAIKDGVFGKLLGGRVSLTTLRTDAYYQESGGWRGTKRWDGGGVMSNQAVHSADDMVYTIGLPARLKADIWTQTHDIEGEDLSMGVMEFEDGLVLQYFATTSYTQKTWSPDLWLYGTEAAYSMTYGGILERPDQKWFLNNAWQDKPPLVVESEWVNAADNFSAAVRQGAPLSCDGKGGFRTQSVLDAMYRSGYNQGVWTERNTTYG
jgi:predicted dehydrogenase